MAGNVKLGVSDDALGVTITDPTIVPLMRSRMSWLSQESPLGATERVRAAEVMLASELVRVPST